MLELKVFLEESYGRLHEWSDAYFVTLIDICSFLCVSGQRGTIAKSMHEEHLCMMMYWFVFLFVDVPAWRLM